MEPFPEDRAFDPERFRPAFRPALETAKGGNASTEEPFSILETDWAGSDTEEGRGKLLPYGFQSEFLRRQMLISLHVLFSKQLPAPYDVESSLVSEFDVFGFALMLDKMGVKKLILQTREEQNHFDRLNAEEARRDFLITRLRQAEKKNLFEKSAEWLASPRIKMDLLSLKDLEEALYFIKAAHYVAWDWGPRLHETPPSQNGEVSPFWKGVLSQSSVWNKIERPLQDWNAWVLNHPEDFIVFLNHLPLEKKRIVLELTAERSLTPALDLAPSAQTTEKKEKETPYQPPQQEIFIEIELVDSLPSLPPADIPPPSPPTPNPTQNGSLGRSFREIMISPETSIALELFVPSRALTKPKEKPKVWSPPMIERFKKMNSGGNWNRLFSNYLERRFPRGAALSAEERGMSALLRSVQKERIR